MDNENNQQGFPEQSPEQTPNQTESGKTYWENGSLEQNTGYSQEAPIQQNHISETPTGQNQVPETPDQFYQQYGQQMNAGALNNQQYQTPPQTYPSEPPRRRSSGKLITAIVVIVLLLSAAATAFAFRDTLKNTLALMTKSPAEYYAYVEKNSMDKSIELMKPYLKKENYDVAYKSSANVTFDHATIDSLLQSTAGMGLSDLESTIGIPFNNLGFDATVSLKDKDLYENIGVKLNDVNLITGEIFMNTLKQEMMYRLPDLSPAFLKMSLADVEGSSNATKDIAAQLEVLTSERSVDFMKRYSSITIDQIDKVALDKNVKLTQGGITLKCSKLTATLDRNDLIKILTSILKEAKQDKFIYDILPTMNITEDEYVKSIEDLEKQLADDVNNTVAENNIIELVIYVDSRGAIVSRDINLKQDGSSLLSIGYTMLNQGNKDEYNVYLKDNTNITIQGHGSQIKNNDAYTGKLTIEINNIPDLPTSVQVDVDYKDVKSVVTDNRRFSYGSYTVSSLAFMGMDFTLDNTVENDIQKSKLTLRMGTAPLVTMDIKTEKLKDFTAPKPSSSDVVYDINDIDSYTATIDTDKYISDLSQKLGVNIQDILSSFLGDMNY